MKIIIAGDGKVGSTLARQLTSEGYNVTLIDSDQRVLEASVERYDVMTVHGNCASMSVLDQAGVMDTDLLIAATSADEINLLCCTTAHAMNPGIHTIARIRTPEYTEQIYKMRELFGLSMTVNPEKQTAKEIAGLLKFPGFLRRDTFAKGRAEIVELRVDQNSKLCNVPLIEMYSIVKCRVLVCAVLRNGTAVVPNRGDFVLQEGDRIFVTAPTENLSILLKNLGVVRRRIRNVVLCGGGRVSYYLASMLDKEGIHVQIIEKNYERCLTLAEQLPDVSVVHGDAGDHSLLESDDLLDCDALVTLTGRDELNMIVSLYAARRGVPRVITKLRNIVKQDIIDTLALGSMVCPKELCANEIVRYVRAMENQSGAAVSVHDIADGQIEAIEFLVDNATRNCGKALKDIKIKPNILVASITREGRTEIPGGNSQFRPGDTLVIVTGRQGSLRQINDIFD